MGLDPVLVDSRSFHTNSCLKNRQQLAPTKPHMETVRYQQEVKGVVHEYHFDFLEEERPQGFAVVQSTYIAKAFFNRTTPAGRASANLLEGAGIEAGDCLSCLGTFYPNGTAEQQLGEFEGAGVGSMALDVLLEDQIGMGAKACLVNLIKSVSLISLLSKRGDFQPLILQGVEEVKGRYVSVPGERDPYATFLKVL